MMVFLILTAILSLSMVELAVSAVRLQGRVIAAKGFEATIQVELIEPYSPAMGNKVEFLEILDKSRVERSIGGVWQAT